MLNKIIEEKWLSSKVVIGLFPANSVGDDIEIYDPLDHNKCIHVQRTLRQQTKKAPGQANFALSCCVHGELPKIKAFYQGNQSSQD